MFAVTTGRGRLFRGTDVRQTSTEEINHRTTAVVRGPFLDCLARVSRGQPRLRQGLARKGGCPGISVTISRCGATYDGTNPNRWSTVMTLVAVVMMNANRPNAISDDVEA